MTEAIRLPTCPSPFQLDRLSADDVSDIERAQLDRHVAGCAACARGLAERAAERADFVPDPDLLARLAAPGAAPVDRPRPRAVRRRVAAVVAPALLCAAGLLLWVRSRAPEQPEPPVIGRSSTMKGGFAARLVVQPAGAPAAIEAAAGSVHRVHPGDRLQVEVSLPERRFVAAYSSDGAGTISRYSPVDAPMVAIEPGGDQVLPNSTILDAVLGREIIAVFACASEADDATLRRHVLAGAPAGCEVSRIELVKVAPESEP